MLDSLNESESLIRTDGMAVLFTIYGITFKMVYVEGGICSLGVENDEDNPLRSVKLDSFLIGETPISEELWAKVVFRTFNQEEKYLPAAFSFKDGLYFLYRLNLLTGQSFRLPTIDEWEYAARGGRYSRGYRFSGSDCIDDVAWYGEDRVRGKRHQMKLKKPNELGLYDMSGNICEYCTCNPHSKKEDETVPWSRSYCNGNYNFEIYRGGNFSAIADECSVGYLFDWDQDPDEKSRGLRLCLSWPI